MAASPLKFRDPLVGRMVGERFRVTERIAAGGMGVVYRAEQLPLGREVALKVLFSDRAQLTTGRFQERFVREASVASKLSHPNTVTVFDYGRDDDGKYYMAMELVEGKSLAAVLKESGALEVERAVHIAMQIARSVREAHDLSVIHRDLKPENVLLTEHDGDPDFVKVVDFGLAKALEGEESEELTETGALMGSPKYLPPEQIRGGPQDGRVDVYSLGVVMYEMLAGRVPFADGEAITVMMAHVQNPVPPIDRKLPKGLQTLVQGCLEKEPSRRPKNMAEVIRQLERVDERLPRNRSKVRKRRPAVVSTSGVVPAGEVADSASFPSAALESAHPPRRRGGSVSWLWWLASVAIATAVVFTLDSSLERQLRDAWTSDWPQAIGGVVPDVALEPEPRAIPKPPPPAPVLLYVTSNPPRASLSINGKDRGLTPAQIELVGAEGKRGAILRVQLRKEGFLPHTITRTLQASDLELHSELAPVPPPVVEEPKALKPERKPRIKARAKAKAKRKRKRRRRSRKAKRNSSPPDTRSWERNGYRASPY